MGGIRDLRAAGAGDLRFVWGEGGLGSFSPTTGLAGSVLEGAVVDLAGGDFDFEAQSGGDPDGDPDRISATALWVSDDVGMQYRVRRRGRRRWVTTGLDVAGDVAGNMVIGGQALIIEIDGQLQGALTVGEDLGRLTVVQGTSTQGTITVAGDAAAIEARHGQIQASVDVGGDLSRLDAHEGTSADGTIDVAGDLGRQFSYRRRGRRRWGVEGFWSGGDVAGAIGIDGAAWLIDVDGQLQAPLTVGGNAERIVLDDGTSADGDISVAGALASLTAGGTTFAGDLTAGSIAQADINSTNGLEGQIDVAGDVGRLHVQHGTAAGATIDLDGDLGRQFSSRRNGRRRWVTEGFWSGGHVAGAISVGGVARLIDIDGQLQAALTITGDAERLVLDQGTSAAGDVTIGGDLGQQYTIRRGGRRRTVSEGLHVRGDLQADVTIAGKAWLIAVAGDLADADLTANELDTVSVTGRVRSTTAQSIRSLLPTTTFYIIDSTWAGYITAGNAQVFDGTVAAQIG